MIIFCYKILFLVQFIFISNLYSATSFTDITIDAGISFSGTSEGVCVFDYNNDELNDILFTTRNGSSNHLFRNEGNMIFTDVSFESNIGISMEARAVVAGDFDNDGDQDVFFGATVGESRLFENNGNGTFQDITNISGIDISNQVRGVAWVDYDSDGFLDLYVGLLYEPNKFFKNNGDGTFIDVAQNIGAAGPLSAGIIMGLGFIDYDRDGDQDLFITQDNNNGNILLKYESSGIFTDVSAISNTDLDVMGMGVAFGDINRDGFFDFYTTNLYENSLLLNSGSGTFSDISASSGTEDIPGSMGWGTFFFDANNDGWIDIYNNNETAFGGVMNSLMINQGDQTFTMLNNESGAVINNNGYGSAFSDFDRDGDLDMVLVGHPSSSGSINLLRNDSDSKNWIIFKLSQPNYNIYAVGSTVELYHGSSKQLNFISAGNGYCSQNTLDVHFGLGSATEVDSVIVIWPDGSRALFTGLEINNYNTLIKGSQNPLSIRTNEIVKEFELSKIYPNPFNKKISISVYPISTEIINIDVYDCIGKLVFGKSKTVTRNEQKTISLVFENMSSGVYLINLRSANHSKFKKISFIK